jgi:hypothetical protein
MKKVVITTIAVVFAFTVASLSFAADAYQTKGTVTKINGNQITIKDEKGKETTFEGFTSGIKAGDKVLVAVTIYLQESQRELTAEEIDFLTKQCLIDRADVDMIKQLSNNAQANILKWTAAKDCKKLTPLKASREYYKKLKPGSRLPLPPPGWDFDWLTDEEYLRFVDILQKAPI